MGCSSSTPAPPPESVAYFFNGEQMAGKAEMFMGEMVADDFTLAFVGPHAMPLPTLDKERFGQAAGNLIASFPDLTFNFNKATPKQNKDGSWAADIVVMGTHTGPAFTPMPGKLPPVETTNKCVKIGPETFTLWTDAAGKVCKIEITPLGAGHPHGPPGFYLEIGGVLPPPAAPLPDCLMGAKVKDFGDWFTGFKSHATETTFPMNGSTYTVSMSRGDACDETKTDVLVNIKDPNDVVISIYAMDFAKFGPVMAEPAFVEMSEKAIVSQDAPLVMTDAPPPGTPPPPEKVDMFFSYVVDDPDKWIKGFLAHGTSKTGDGMWSAEAKYTRGDFCDESKTKVFKSAYNPKRVGGVLHSVDLAKMGEFMADPSFGEISEVLKFDMSTMVMKTLAPMPPPPK